MGHALVLETLHRLGVTDMFGYPGGAVIPIYDEMFPRTMRAPLIVSALIGTLSTSYSDKVSLEFKRLIM